MAYTFESLPVISKVKIGNQVYFLKDLDVRKILDTFGTAVTFNTETTITNSNNLPTSAAIMTYIQNEVAGLAGAVHFKGIVTELPSPADSENGDIVIIGTAEYIFAGKTADTEGSWQLFGDEGVYLTISGAEVAYVKKTLTIAGINLEDSITAEELKTALGLGALAYKNSATGNLIDYPTGIEGVSYTPAGSVAFAKDPTAGIQISGTVSAPTITVTPATASLRPVESVGKLPVYVAPSVTEVKSQFASDGIIASIDGVDTEMLVLTSAVKKDAITSTGFSAGSYTEGTLPTLGGEQTIVTGISSATATAPVFTGDKFGTKFTGKQATITPTLITENKSVTVQ